MIKWVEVKVKLTPTKCVFKLMAPDTIMNFMGFFFTNATLIVRKVKLVIWKSLLDHEKVLQRAIGKCPLKHIVLKNASTPRGMLSHTQGNFLFSQTSTHVVVGLLITAVFNDVYIANTFNVQT